MLWMITGVLVIGAALAGSIMSQVEQPSYRILEAQGAIEIREYAPVIVAETSVSGDRETAINQGFRNIADYIFGNNTLSEKIAMTAPVTQQAGGEKIAMTAPVLQTGEDNAWIVRFVMPARYTIDTLPTPNSDSVRLKEIPATRYAAVRFSGMAGAQSLAAHYKELAAYLEERHIKAQAAAVYAFYNPPWTLPFLRRNEVLLEIEP